MLKKEVWASRPDLTFKGGKPVYFKGPGFPYGFAYRSDQHSDIYYIWPFNWVARIGKALEYIRNYIRIYVHTKKAAKRLRGKTSPPLTK